MNKLMSLQIIQDGNGKPAGVFIPIDDWTLIKSNYPDIDSLSFDIPEWQKQLIDKRMAKTSIDENNIKSIDELFEELDSNV